MDSVFQQLCWTLQNSYIALVQSSTGLDKSCLVQFVSMPTSKKHTNRTLLRASQIAPLIVEKGLLYNRPIFKGHFSVVFTKKVNYKMALFSRVDSKG
jgi:hypothetical protein